MHLLIHLLLPLSPSAIHQPSSLLFEQFDRLLLLEKGGETVYFGPVGKDSKDLVKYFSDNGAQCPSDVNPAEVSGRMRFRECVEGEARVRREFIEVERNLCGV